MTVRPNFVARAQRKDAEEAALLGLRRPMRKRQVAAARHFAVLAGSGHFVHCGCASIEEYGEKEVKCSARETRVLVNAGIALDLRPELESLILDCRISLDAAAILKPILAKRRYQMEGDDWLRWAEEKTTRDLKLAVHQRIREVDGRQPTSVMTVVLTSEGREKFEKARRIASRKAKKLLDEGQAVEVIADHYLDSFDPDRKQPRARRTPDTEGDPGRHVPNEVERELRARFGEGCAVEGCSHTIWIQKAHLKPHREGGSREADNLIPLCYAHHLMFDEGWLVNTGTAEKPVFRFVGARAPPE